jgi:hypothetical protein
MIGQMEHEWDRDSKSSASHTIKKAISHQSLSKRVSNFSSASSPSIPSDDVADRAPRKQRSFHHTSRSILPSLPMPLRSPPPVPSQSSPSLEASSVVFEQSRASTTTSFGRKRLFSGGSAKRPSSQIFSRSDDDHQSVFVSEDEQTQGSGVPSTNSFVQPESPLPSAGNEVSPDSPATSTEYTPQMILSPAEMLRLEASFDNDTEDQDFGIPRQRVHSFASISTSMSHGTERSSASKHYIVDPGISSTLRIAVQSSASPTITSQRTSTSPSPSSSYISSPTGLPLPPRPRRLTNNNDHEASFIPLSPPPIRRQSSRASTYSHSSKASARSQPVRSIMKKPSFLDIEDGRQQIIPTPSRFAGNFLDLERGKDSFDTIRSEDGGLG